MRRRQGRGGEELGGNSIPGFPSPAGQSAWRLPSSGPEQEAQARVLQEMGAMKGRDNFVSRRHTSFRNCGKHVEHFRTARHLLTSGPSEQLPPKAQCLRSED